MSAPAALAVLALLGSSAALAEEPPPPIIDGELTEDFGAVGVLVALDSRGRGANYCSGTLVDTNWVVTAAHCVEGAAEYEAYGYDLYFMVGTDIYSARGIDDYAVIVDQTPHPRYSSRDLQHDIAVLQLGGRGITAVDPIPMRTDSLGRGNRGDDVTYVGWGIDSDRGTGSGYKRTVDVPVYEVYGGVLITHDDSGSRNICSGDSGGAALMENSDGELELAAVNSFGFMLDGSRVLCDDPDAAAGAWRVDYDYDFIIDTIGYEPEVEASGSDGGGSGSDDGGGSDGGTDTTEGEGEDAPDAGSVEEFGSSDAEVEKGGCSAVGGASSLGLAGLALLGLARRRRD